MKIENLRRQNHNTIIATFDVFIEEWGLVLRSLKLIKKKDGGEFISYPSNMKEINGEKKYFRLAYFKKDQAGRDRDAFFQKAAKELVYKELNDDKPEHHDQMTFF